MPADEAKFPALWLADQSWLHYISLAKLTTSAKSSQLLNILSTLLLGDFNI